MNAVGVVALWIVVFTIPWENAIIVSGVGTVARLVGLIAAPIAACAVVLRGEVRYNGFLIAVALFVVHAMWSIYWSSAPSIEIPWRRNRSYIQLMIMVWLLYQFLDSQPRVANFLRAYILGACVAAFSTLHAYQEGTMTGYQRFAASNFDANDIAIVMALAIPMAWYLAMVERRWIDLLLLCYIPLGVFAILLTASRAGSIAAAIAVAAPLLIGGTRSGVFGRVGVGVLILGVAVIGFHFVPETSLARIGTVYDEVTEGTLNSRTVFWARGFEVFADNPWVGVGAANFRVLVGKAPHNVFLAIGVEQGLTGLLLLMGCLAVVVKDILRMPRAERGLWYILLTVLMVGLMSLNWEWRKQMWIILLLATAHGEAVAGRWGVLRRKRASHREAEGGSAHA